MHALKRDLVLAAAGDHSLHRHWVRGGADFDLFLIYFGDGVGHEADARFHRRAKGYKFPLIQDALRGNPWLYNYRYVWLPDDDVFATPDDIRKIFRMMEQYDLAVAQPSIMGWYGVDMTLHQKGSLLRYTNWVEIMCPCFSSAALAVCEATFKENQTGWSIEPVWNVLLGHPTDKIAILDDAVVFHTRPVMTGETHRSRPDPLAAAMREAGEVYRKWNLKAEMEKDAKVGQPTGGEVYCSVVYRQLFKEMERAVPKPERFWPPSDEIKRLIARLQPADPRP